MLKLWALRLRARTRKLRWNLVFMRNESVRRYRIIFISIDSWSYRSTRAAHIVTPLYLPAISITLKLTTTVKIIIIIIKLTIPVKEFAVFATYILF